MADIKLDLEEFNYNEDEITGEITKETKQIEDDKDDSQKESSSTEMKSDSGGSWFGLLSLSYYQSFFDVTTSDVVSRVIAGMIPFPWNLSSLTMSNPDLYGPFWLCMTLILTTALSGNLATLFSGSTKWEFHFHEVIVLTAVIYSYTWCLPFLLWGFMIWRKTDDRYSLLQLLTIYGYSMAAFIPLTLLWLINIESLRWLLLAVAILTSGFVLVRSIWQPFRNETRRIAVIVMVLVLLLHAGMAIGFKYYYFSSSLAPEPLIASSPTLSSTSASGVKHGLVSNSSVVSISHNLTGNFD